MEDINIIKTELDARINRLNSLLENNSILVLESANKKYRSLDTCYNFRQNSNFYYFTGIEDEDYKLILFKLNNVITSYLFIPDRDLNVERWEGARLSLDDAKNIFSNNHILFNIDFRASLFELLNPNINLYIDLDNNSLINDIKNIITDKSLIIDINSIIAPLRVVKSEYEVSLMRKVGEISSSAHNYLLANAKLGMSERTLECMFRSFCLDNELTELAYQPIVGAGNNACTLHYIKNNALIKKDDLILIDAGAELDLYSSDITRTFPINKKFSAEQKAIYELVLYTQQSAIDSLRPGLSWFDLSESVIKNLVSGLLDLGILSGTLQQQLETKEYRKYYMHGHGHWLGLDTHDIGGYKDKNDNHILLKANNVLTVEPGIYIDANDNSVDEKWRGIGIRIEDNLLITPDSCENLTKSAIKEVVDIEHLRSLV